MKKYDPFSSPNPGEWLGVAEAERIEMVLRYHRKARIEMPNEQAHAAIHVIVENQTAMGDQTPVRDTLVRLMSEGLDRHDAVHAIGCVLSDHLFAAAKDNKSTDLSAAYYRELQSLTAECWLKEWGQD